MTGALMAWKGKYSNSLCARKASLREINFSLVNMTPKEVRISAELVIDVDKQTDHGRISHFKVRDVEDCVGILR